MSRELDAEIAKKVMGWRQVGKGWHTRPEHRPSKDYPGTIINNWENKGEHDFLVPPGSQGGVRERVAFCGCEGDLEIPPYSTSIEAAWEVVEHMRKYSHRSVLNLVSPTDDSEHWWALFSKKDVADPIERFSLRAGWQQADTAPEAICFAALRAISETP